MLFEILLIADDLGKYNKKQQREKIFFYLLNIHERKTMNI